MQTNLREIEKGILGFLILTPEESDYAFERLNADCFETDPHRAIFYHLRNLWETDSPIDSVALSYNLEAAGSLAKVGGREYIIDLVDSAVIPSSLPFYVDRVLESKRCRDLKILGAEIVNRVKGGDSSGEIVAEIEGKLNQITQSACGDSFSSLEGLNLESLKDGAKKYPTKFLDLDRKIGGLAEGEFWVIAGRPSVGKTAWALNLVVNMAREGVPVVFVSIEMSLPSLKKRVISSETRSVESRDLETDVGIEKNRVTLEATVQELRKLPLYFDASPNQTTTSIRAKTRRLVRNHKIKLLVVDYLQLVEGPKSETREREISAISGMLKALAKELDIVTVALCQLNRRCEERVNKKPILADLRESGAIEQDADGVILLHRPDLYRDIKEFEDGTSTSGVVEVTIAKNRNGETGIFRMSFLKKFTRFENYQKEEK